MVLNLESVNPEAVAIVDDEGGEHTYGQLRQYMEVIGGQIPSRSVVFILSENTPAAVAALIGCLHFGIIPVLLSSGTDAALLDSLFQLYRPQYILQPSTLPNTYPSEKKAALLDFELLATGETPYPVHPDLALLLPTSGSTGSPKLVRHSLHNIEANAKNVALALNISDADRPLLILPFHYTMGLSIVCSHLIAGATVVMTKKTLTDRALWKVFDEQRITSLTGVPFSFEILHKLRFFRNDFPHLNLISQGGGKLSRELFSTIAAYASEKGKRFVATYGQTEATARMSYLPAEWAAEKVCSIGLPIPDGIFTILDDNGHETTAGEATGELVYRGPNVTLGYANTIQDLGLGDENQGVLHTGDIAMRDSDGYYFIVGRKSRFLKLYGVRVGLDDVEHLVKSAFNIDCACTGNDDKMLVFIVDASYAEVVKQMILSKTGLFHQAIDVVVKDEIKRNQAGKVIYTD